VKGAENKKLMEAPGVKDRFASVGNLFAVTEVLAFLASVPVMVALEGSSWGRFVALLQSSTDLQFYLVASGLAFYLYNEVSSIRRIALN
jgi:solute carrier family 35 protein E1